LEFRRDRQKGYLKGKKTSDLVSRYTGVVVYVTGISAQGKAISKFSEESHFQKFMEQISTITDSNNAVLGTKKSGLLFPGPNMMMFLGRETLLADLAALYTEPGETLLPGDLVSICTEGQTLMARSFVVNERVKRASGKGNASMKGYTHLYGVVQGGPVKVDGAGGLTDTIFKARKSLHENAAGTTGSTKTTSQDVKDEEWDD
jgi:hypothetical protein